jgi:heptosyltransferase-2
MSRKEPAPRSIVVRLPNWVGDAAMASPAVRALRERFPESEIFLHGKPYVQPVLNGNPWTDGFIPYDSKDAHRGWSGFRQALREIRDFHFNSVVILPHSFSTAWFYRRAGIPSRIGLARQGRAWLLTHSVAPYRESGRTVPRYMAEVYLDIVASLGCSPRDKTIELFTTSEEEAGADAALASVDIDPEEPWTGLNPGAAFGSSKCWPTEHFARLGDLLRETYRRPVLVCYGPAESETARKILQEMRGDGGRLSPKPIDLGSLKALVKRCKLFVTNDTGPRHFAVAFDTPSVILVGPMDPRYTQTDQGRAVVLREPVECSPCNLPRCPIDHRCLVRITPERVLEATRRFLE